MTVTLRRSLAEEDRHIARRVGSRIRDARTRAGLTQREVAGARYTKAYISALENGLIKPSVAALSFIAERLGTTAAVLLADPEVGWLRVEADTRLAAGDPAGAGDLYTTLLDRDPDPATRAELLLGLAEAHARAGRHRDSLAAAAEAAERFSRLSRPREVAYSRYWVASAQHQAGNSDEALGLLGDLLADVRHGLDVTPDFEVRILIALATSEAHAGEPDRALAHLTEASARVGDLDDRRRATYLFSLAVGYRDSGDLEAATRTGLQSLALYRAAEASTEAASLSNELALIYLSLGNLDRARGYAGTARGEFERRGDERWLAHVLDTEARIELEAGNFEPAVAGAQRAIEVAERTGDRVALLNGHLTAGRAARRLGSSRLAHDHFRAAADLARADGGGRRREVLSEWGDLYAAEGDVATAYALAREALDPARA
jgi:tetratricopeptide (TPR) repeat protein